MLSYTGRRNLFGTLTTNSTSANLTIGDSLMNAADKRILTKRAWAFLERSDTETTVAATQSYQIPQKVGKLKNITVTVGTTIYTPKEIVSEEDWTILNQTSSSSNVAEFFHVRAGKVYLYPTPASSSNTITFYGRAQVKDLSIADYSTGGVLTATNGSASIAGTGTTFTASMVGRFLKITESDTANKGDGEWYEIASYTSATAITLTKEYLGISIAAGNAAYAIGQMAPYPEGYHELPVYEACKIYYTSIQPNKGKAELYGGMAKDLLKQLETDWGGHTSGVDLDSDYARRNPNLYPSSIG